MVGLVATEMLSKEAECMVRVRKTVVWQHIIVVVEKIYLMFCCFIERGRIVWSRKRKLKYIREYVNSRPSTKQNWENVKDEIKPFNLLLLY